MRRPALTTLRVLLVTEQAQDSEIVQRHHTLARLGTPAGRSTTQRRLSREETTVPVAWCLCVLVVSDLIKRSSPGFVCIPAFTNLVPMPRRRSCWTTNNPPRPGKKRGALLVAWSRNVIVPANVPSAKATRRWADRRDWLGNKNSGRYLLECVQRTRLATGRETSE